jgi:putative ABC transport system permease protein
MLSHWLTTAWRQLVANPLFSVITIFSLSIGCCGALLAAANIRQHLSFERWIPDADRIVLLRETLVGADRFGEEARHYHTPSPFMRFGLRQAIEGRIPGMAAQTRVTDCFYGVIWPDTEAAPEVGAGHPPAETRCVDGTFFNVFRLDFIEGSPAGALDAPDSLVISEDVARKYFGNEPALGKTFPTNRPGLVLRVTGVIRQPPAATHLQLQSLASMEMRRRTDAAGRPDNTDSSMYPSGFGEHYLRMTGDVDPDVFISSARRQIQMLIDERGRAVRPEPDASSDTEPDADVSWTTVSLVPILDIHLGGEELTGMTSSADASMLAALAASAAALIGMCAFNYVTLSLALSLRRRGEVGVRKVLGASHGDLIRHYLTESALVTAISLAFGFALAEMLHPWFARMIGQPETLFEMHDPAFVLAAVIAFALLALCTGAYPAFYLANVRPGAEQTSMPRGMGGAVSGALLGIQIAVATVLLTLAATMAAQAAYVAARPLGFDMRNKYESPTLPCPAALAVAKGAQDANAAAVAFAQCRRQYVALLERTPGVGRVSSNFIFALIDDSITTEPFGRTAMGEELGKAAQYMVAPGYLDLMGTKLLAGRLFDENSAFDRVLAGKLERDKVPLAPAIITRAMLPHLGAQSPEDALGQRIQMQGRESYQMEIVGVVEDWYQRSLRYRVHPIIFVSDPDARFVTFEINDPNPERVIEQVTTDWFELVGLTAAPRGKFIAYPVGWNNAKFYEADSKLMQMVISFSSLAMLVAGLGVFGLSAFEMRRRVREIGIRKALGAPPWRIAGIAVGRVVAFAACASVSAWPVAWWVSQAWLDGFAYRTQMGPLLAPLASLAVVGALALAVSFNALRAAAVRPNSALRI